MSCEDETAELLREAGHKLTPQRMMILRALRHSGGHVTAGQIAEQVRAAYPFVDVSTVYRTLDVLKRMRLDEVVAFGCPLPVDQCEPTKPPERTPSA